VPVILELIRGLAEYERLLHQVEATPALIRRHGFGRRPYFETLICRRGTEPVGFALYFFTYSTFLGRPSLYLEDLFVRPEERGRGGGKALLSALAKIAGGRGLRPHGVGGPRLEPPGHPLLQAPRRRPAQGVDPHAHHR
jgi:GNAT superfamily N-acetyltransferase